MSQALAGSSVSELAFGSPINASALLIILLHQVIESHTLVSHSVLSLESLTGYNVCYTVESLLLCVVLQTWIHVLVLVFSGGLYFGFVLLFSVFCVTCSPPTNPLGVETLQMSEPLFYIVCALTTVVALLPRYTHTLSKTLL